MTSGLLTSRLYNSLLAGSGWVGCLVHYNIFSSIPGLYPLDAGSTSYLLFFNCDNQKCFQIAKCRWGRWQNCPWLRNTGIEEGRHLPLEPFFLSCLPHLLRNNNCNILFLLLFNYSCPQFPPLLSPEPFFKVRPCSAFSLFYLAKFQLLGSALSDNANY